MVCVKDCHCDVCEMFEKNYIIVLVDDTNPLNIKKVNVNGVKCNNYAKCFFNAEGLKEDGFGDDVLYVSRFPFLKDFF